MDKLLDAFCTEESMLVDEVGEFPGDSAFGEGFSIKSLMVSRKEFLRPLDGY